MPETWPRAELSAARFHTLAPVLNALESESFPKNAALSELSRHFALCNSKGMSIRFEDVSVTSYESLIYEKGIVPTREQNWHDLFNALTWCVFPRAKALLNQLHVEQLIKQGADTRRNAARDVLTLFDESGMVIACCDLELRGLLEDFRWKDLFWHRREAVSRRMRFYVFGHALHEQLLQPYRGITAKAVFVEVDDAFMSLESSTQLEFLDEALCAHFAAPEVLAGTRSLHPVPVLGIPGWWPQNEAAAYYDDTGYFRPGRRTQKQSPA